ncbi:MAG: cyclophilin-like family protein [Candidatus Bipolaricaulaceae bacterium]
MEAKIRTKGVVLRAKLIPERAPCTVEAIARALPIRSMAHRWGQEVYFSVPVELVEMGDVAYWPAGPMLCLLFGPTSASRYPGEIRPASAVTGVGKILGNPAGLAAIEDGTGIEILPAS